MIDELPSAPTGAFEAACVLAATLPEAGHAEIGRVPIPVYQMRMGGNGEWDPDVSLSGFAFPVFLDQILDALIFVDTEQAESGDPFQPGRGDGLSGAFDLAIQLGDSRDEALTLAIIRVPGVVEAFWLAGSGPDIFIDMAAAMPLAWEDLAVKLADDEHG